jgi:anaerobic C4-dicarboxylate transporter
MQYNAHMNKSEKINEKKIIKTVEKHFDKEGEFKKDLNPVYAEQHLANFVKGVVDVSSSMVGLAAGMAVVMAVPAMGMVDALNTMENTAVATGAYIAASIPATAAGTFAAAKLTKFADENISDKFRNRLEKHNKKLEAKREKELNESGVYSI